MMNGNCLFDKRKIAIARNQKKLKLQKQFKGI